MEAHLKCIKEITDKLASIGSPIIGSDTAREFAPQLFDLSHCLGGMCR